MSNNKHTPHHLDQATWDALKAAGFSEQELYDDQPYGPIFHSYSRQQAIADGVLVDLSQPTLEPMLRMCGVKVHTAMTTTAFCQTISKIDDPDAPSGKALLTRLWNVLSALRLAIQKSGGQTDSVSFSVIVDGQTINLWALMGPGDRYQPVLTIMLEGED